MQIIKLPTILRIPWQKFADCYIGRKYFSSCFNGLLQLYRPCTLTFVINQIAIFEHYDKYLNISLKLNSKYSEFFLLIVQNSYFMAYLARFLLLCLHRPETKNKKTRKITCLT